MNKRMRLCLIIVLIFAVSLAVFGCAETANDSESPQFISSIAECGGELYAMTMDGNSLYQWKSDADYTLYRRSGPDFQWVGSLMEHGGQLYCLGYEGEALRLYLISCSGQAWTTDDGVEVQTGLPAEAVASSGICGDLLIVQLQYDGTNALALFDMQTKELTRHSFDGEVRSLVYGADFVIAQTYYANRNVWRLEYFNPFTNEKRTLQENAEAISLLCVDSQGCLYYQKEANGQLFSAPIDDPSAEQPTIALPEDGVQCCAIFNGQIITGGAYGILAHSLTAGEEPQSFTIGYVPVDLNMGVAQQQIASYAQDHPHLQITMTEMTDREIMDGLLYQSETPDIFVLNSNSQAFASMVKQGYYVDLSRSDRIAKDNAAMEPSIREFLQENGAVIGVPLGIEATELTYAQSLFREAPNTWKELFAFMAAYPQLQKEEELENAILYASVEPEVQLLMKAMQWYYQKESCKGEAVRFDSAEFLSIVEAYQGIPFVAIGEANSAAAQSGNVARMLEFDLPYSLSGNSDMEILKLSDEAGEDSPSFAILSVAIVSPFSKQTEECISFLEHLLQTRIAGMEIALKPSVSEPVRSENADEVVQQYENEHSKLSEQLQTAGPIDRPELEEQIQEIERSTQKFESGWAWIVGPDALNNWKSYCARLQIVGYNGIFDNPDAVSSVRTLILQLNGNSISPKDFAGKLDKMFYLQQREGY